MLNYESWLHLYTDFFQSTSIEMYFCYLILKVDKYSNSISGI